MSELSDLCDKVVTRTQAILELTQSQEPSLADISELIRERTQDFSTIKNLQDPDRVQLLTQLAQSLAPLDAHIFEWMQSHQQDLAASLQKVKNGSQRNAQHSAEPRILIQSA